LRNSRTASAVMIRDASCTLSAQNILSGPILMVKFLLFLRLGLLQGRELLPAFL
jgi:hypothetical protein